VENRLIFYLKSKYFLLYTGMHMLCTDSDSYPDCSIRHSTIHQTGWGLDNYLITVLTIKTGQPALCSQICKVKTSISILFSFLSQKFRTQKGVFPLKKPVIPDALCRLVPPHPGCFTVFAGVIYHTCKRIQRNAISMSARACLPVFHNLFITIFDLFLPSFQKNRSYIYVYHSENKR